MPNPVGRWFKVDAWVWFDDDYDEPRWKWDEPCPFKADACWFKVDAWVWFDDDDDEPGWKWDESGATSALLLIWL